MPSDLSLAKIIGFEPAPKVAWHLDEKEPIHALLYLDETLFAAADERGLRDYLYWETYAEDVDLYEYGRSIPPGRTIDVVEGPQNTYSVLSEDHEHQIVTTYTYQEGFNAHAVRRSIVDQIEMPAGTAQKIKWHNGHLWVTKPTLSRIFGINIYSALSPKGSETPQAEREQPMPENRLVYQGRIGGDMAVRGVSGNYVYVTVSNELMIYDVSEIDNPVFVNRMMFEDHIQDLVVHNQTAIVQIENYRRGFVYGKILDLTDPISPKPLEDLTFLSRVGARENIALITLAQTVKFIDLDRQDFASLSKLHPFQSIYDQAQIQISQDSKGKVDLSLDETQSAIKDFLLLGNTLIFSWHSPACIDPGEKEPDCYGGVLLYDIDDIGRPILIGSLLTEGIIVVLDRLTMDGFLEGHRGPNPIYGDPYEFYSEDISSILPDDTFDPTAFRIASGREIATEDFSVDSFLGSSFRELENQR